VAIPIDLAGLRRVDAFGGVQPPRWGHADSCCARLKISSEGLLGASLLGGDHVIESYLKAARRSGEKVVIHIGDDGELITRLELLQRRHGIGERQPNWLGKSGSERPELSRLESEALAKTHARPTRDFAVRTEFSLLASDSSSEYTFKSSASAMLLPARREWSPVLKRFTSPVDEGP